MFEIICSPSKPPFTTKLQSTVHNAASIAMDCLSTQCARVLTCQEDNTGCDLGWLTWTSLRCCELFLRLLTHSRWDEGRPNWTGCHGVHANASVDVLVAQTTSEWDDSTLCRSIVEKIRSTDVGVDGGVVDDCGTFLHVWEDVFWEVEEGMDVRVEGLFPLLPSLTLVSARFMKRSGNLLG